MTRAAVLLAVLAVVLAEPGSRALAAARWPHRAPRAALVLWQAVGLAAGLAALGAGLSLALVPLAGSLPTALERLCGDAAHLHPFDGLPPWRAAVLIATVALGTDLAGALLLATLRTLRRRRDHRRIVDLVGTREPRLGGAVVLDHPVAVAYCLPGLRSRIVVSAGALGVLDADQLGGVLAHEQAHVTARHDLVVLPFLAWSAALPLVPGVRRAGAAVAALVEMLADDRARRGGARTRPLALAIARLGAAPTPAGALGIGGRAVLARVERLLTPPRPLPAAARLGVYAAAGALTALPLAVLAW